MKDYPICNFINTIPLFIDISNNLSGLTLIFIGKVFINLYPTKNLVQKNNSGCVSLSGIKP